MPGRNLEKYAKAYSNQQRASKDQTAIAKPSDLHSPN